MQRAGSRIVREILRYLEDEGLTGLATLRHYPMEKRIYARFGRCGFALDMQLGSGQGARRVSVLVEAVARGSGRGKKKGYEKAPGTITALFAEVERDGIKYRTMRGQYRDMNELFSYVEEVRAAFYRRYNELRMRGGEGMGRVEAEVFHSVGIKEPDLYLGV
ncbi:MAG: hypothetical protein QXP81_06670 [Nitrososphaerota archaeon]